MPAPNSSEAPASRGRSSAFRLYYCASLVILALWAPSLPAPRAQSCGGCPEWCGTSECSCGEFNCGSAEFCSIAGNADPCLYPGGCPAGEVYSNGCCATLGSPIVIDLADDGFSFTNKSAGVVFAIGPTAQMYQVSWTEPSSDDSWLVLDRNGNGLVDNGTELFGNHTPQPEPPRGQSKNGYLALAVSDSPREGGNSDGEITGADRVYSALRLWRDINHNGISEANELSTLVSKGVLSIGLDYRQSKRRDEFGNVLRYRSKVMLAPSGRRDGPRPVWSVDVFLLVSRNFT